MRFENGVRALHYAETGLRLPGSWSCQNSEFYTARVMSVALAMSVARLPNPEQLFAAGWSVGVRAHINAAAHPRGGHHWKENESP